MFGLDSLLGGGGGGGGGQQQPAPKPVDHTRELENILDELSDVRVNLQRLAAAKRPPPAAAAPDKQLWLLGGLAALALVLVLVRRR